MNEKMISLADQAAEQLIGTCKSIAELGPKFEDAMNDKTFCARLDELAFECELCNWWHETSEMVDSWVCQQCSSETDYD